jgi:exodeoxyribonuclease V alpha subunit
MPFVPPNQEETDARELARALLSALALPADHASLKWAERAYRTVLDGQSCAILPAAEAPAMDAVVGPPDQIQTPLVLRRSADEALLYLRHMDELEAGLAKSVLQLAVRRAEPWSLDAAKDIAAADHLNEEQADALRRLAERSFMILTGGPGTGKTYTLNSLLKYAVAAGALAPAQIRLVAPTGRAARRIADGLAALRQQPAFTDLVEPQTIHSLLYEPEAFDGMQLLVVDESSMVDLMLFNEVIDKLPAGCSLVLVGDPNQLPSVEVGSVLADLCEALALSPNKVELVRQVRSKDAPEIMRFAESVLGGKGRDAVALVTPTPEAVIEHVLPAFTALRDKARAGDVEGSMALVDEVRVLCSHVRGPLGAETLSRLIAEKLGIRVSPPGPGSLIMVTRNDRRGTGLSNGDVGVMVGELVYFRGNPVGFDLNRLPEFASAFATTIHKAQGSEYGHAVVVLGSSQREGFLNRQLIYTGITRARRQVTLVADRADFLAACAREVPRASGLKQRLV